MVLAQLVSVNRLLGSGHTNDVSRSQGKRGGVGTEFIAGTFKVYILCGYTLWTFCQLKQDRKTGDAALLSMTQNVSARLEVQTRKSL